MRRKINKKIVLAALGAILAVIIIAGVIFGVSWLVNKSQVWKQARTQKSFEEGTKDYKEAVTGTRDGKTLSVEERKELYEKSANLLAEATKYKKDDTEALLQLAVAYYNLNQFDKAIETYKKLIAIEPNKAINYTNIAHAYMAKGDKELAKQNYQKSMNLDPKISVNYMNLAIILKEENKKEEAIKILEEGLSKNPDDKLLKELLGEYKK